MNILPFLSLVNEIKMEYFNGESEQCSDMRVFAKMEVRHKKLQLCNNLKNKDINSGQRIKQKRAMKAIRKKFTKVGGWSCEEIRLIYIYLTNLNFN